MKPDDKLDQKWSWVYLINLVFFFVPLFTVKFLLWQYTAMAIALVLFLMCYFWAYRCHRADMYRPIIGIVLVSILITPVNPGSVSMFAYAGFFIGYANPWRRYIMVLTALLGVLIALNLLFTLHWPYFLHLGIPVVAAVSLLGWAEQQNMHQRLAKQRSEDEITQLATTVERERISRDLHDILGHTLSSIILKADLAEKLLAHQQLEASQQQLAELSQIARDALSQVRQSVSGYKHQGLAQEVTKLLSRLRDAGFQADLNGTIPNLDSRIETGIVLALTELVTNVMRHSNGNRCQLSIVQQGSQVQFSLSDNGSVVEICEGNGIKGLRERLAAISAILTLHVQNGVTATIQLPLREQTL